MKQGRSLEELAKEIIRQKDAKHDYVTSTDVMQMRYVIGRQNAGMRLVVENDEHPLNLGLKPMAHEQIAQHTKIPKLYYDRMLTEAPGLLASNVNTWFAKNPAMRMVRTLDNDARAFLSNGYRRRDNSDFIEAALPPLLKLGVEVMSCEVTESRLYLKVVDHRIKKDIPTGKSLGDGSHTFFDTASPALVLSNSEVGLGALVCQTSIYTHMCTNLAVFAERSMRKYHIGARVDIGEETYKLLSDETLALTDQAFWAQITDVVKAAFDQAQFDAICEKIGEASQNKIEGDPVKVIELAQKKFQLTDGERGSILSHLIKGGDLTQYGLHAAVTRAAEDLPSYDRASQFEQLGGKIIELKPGEWREFAKAA